MEESSGLEKITINFPRILNLRRIKELLVYVSKEVQAKINYSVGLNGRINECASPEDESLGVGKTEEYVERISGTIIVPKDFVFVQFNLQQGGKSHTYFDKLRFDTGSYDFDELNPQVVALMDKVREKVEGYFSRKAQVSPAQSPLARQ
ncbi:MAG: hypothetical protein PHH00_01875 [Candidatus Nanoarchaeia archaeon]|nr:hypothetical protein [Candidatus Nanoarchaeia archaeon]